MRRHGHRYFHLSKHGHVLDDQAVIPHLRRLTASVCATAGRLVAALAPSPFAPSRFLTNQEPS